MIGVAKQVGALPRSPMCVSNGRTTSESTSCSTILSFMTMKTSIHYNFTWPLSVLHIENEKRT